MMTSRPATDIPVFVQYQQLDVFSNQAGGGNPLAVVIGADGWSGARMQSLASWLNIVETTFVLPATRPDADYDLRIFTPLREIPYAGHPSVGSAWAAITTHFATPNDGKLIQNCGAGIVELRVETDASSASGPSAIFVEAPKATILAHGKEAARAIQNLVEPQPFGALGAMLVEGGRRWWIAELQREQDVRGYQPQADAIAALAHATDTLGLCIFARGPGQSLVVRAFPCGVGIDEDPASGAANGLIASAIAALDPEGALAQGYRVSQGREIGHDATIEVRIKQGDEGPPQIFVGGACHLVIDGRLAWDGALAATG